MADAGRLCCLAVCRTSFLFPIFTVFRSLNAHHIHPQLIKMVGVSDANNGALSQAASRPASFPIVAPFLHHGKRAGSSDADDGGGRPGRTVHVSGIPAGVTIAQVLNLVSFGPLEHIIAYPSPSAFKDPPSTSSSAFPALLRRPSHENDAPSAGASLSSPSPSEGRLRWDHEPHHEPPAPAPYGRRLRWDEYPPGYEPDPQPPTPAPAPSP
ncbi:hypothetical protein B0H16DRAFT_1473853 [Mycena metata]|uniref:Uncharacterized protein n=1 Tax=Mycena metata TaxID=1033252 RepID=A0AAD7HIG8_9AGAR|nr:hypothetical protein B0H16DRAFT_1473853 [Mycena metata]